MRLKKIVLVGFKSFAEKTTLNFESGITCIVGPNGCGKSNIADAFRWVLGEQSAKSLRGHKMPDVIFAGASQRKSLNFAEVSLTLADVQGALPLDYEEITITRRLHRSGESEYFINSNPVRLKDIHSLLFDSGIGRNAFSIFEQGKIDQVINYSPLERRFIFEEAAGIVRFLHRKQEAFKKLEQSDLNLSRANDIHLEVEKNISLLQEQAEKALVFKENQARLAMLDKTAFLLRWQATEKKKEIFYNQMLAQQNEWEGSLQLIVKKHHQLAETKLIVQENAKRWKEKNEEFFNKRSAFEVQKSEFQSNQIRAQEILQKVGKLKKELEDLHLTRQVRQETLKEIQISRQKIEADFVEIESTLADHGGKLKQKENEVVQLRQERYLKQQELLQCTQRESVLASEVKQLELRIENNADRLEQLKLKIVQFAEECARSLIVMQERKTTLQQLSELVDTHKDRLEQYEDDLKSLQNENEIKRREYEACRKKELEKQARCKFLLKMREDLEGFSAGSKRLLQESNQEKSPLYQYLKPLYEYFKPEPEMAEALSAVLRTYAQTLVVQTEGQLKQILEFAQNNLLQDYSLICLEHLTKMSKHSEKPSKLEFKIESNEVVAHFLKEIQIWDDYSQALAAFSAGLKKTEGWISQGCYVDRRGVFFNIKANENHVFLRESELTGLQAEISLLETHLEKLEKQLNQLQQKISMVQSERAEVDKQLRREEMKLVEVNFGLQRALADQEKSKVQQKNHETEREQIEQQIGQQQMALEKVKEGHAVSQQELKQRQVNLQFFEQELVLQEETLRMQQQEEKEKGQTYQQMLEHKRRLNHQCHLLESKEQDHDHQVERITDECGELQERYVTLQKDNGLLQESIQEIEAQLNVVGSECKNLELEAERLKLTLDQIEKEGMDLQSSAKNFELQIAHLKAQQEQCTLSASGLREDLQEKYAHTVEELLALPLPTDRPQEQIEKQMRALKQDLQEAGDVNLTAIEELDKHRVRHEFLAQQITDLNQSKEELMQMIAQLDAESRRLLKETFELVRRNFQKNFGILFNGGEADLQFIGGADNILEAGIEIIAKPPGKQMRSISLMSGGEKCLTAVALLFAIFEVKPAPFCILDEIDAPLDDTNIERFVNVVKHFVDRCQFLIITHNKRTMAIGDVLFGVSMEEKGVSKLLSLEFSHESIPEAALV